MYNKVNQLYVYIHPHVQLPCHSSVTSQEGAHFLAFLPGQTPSAVYQTVWSVSGFQVCLLVASSQCLLSTQSLALE